MTSSFRIVVGHNGTPVPLEAISPPLLAEFATPESILTEWHDEISLELDGDRTYVQIGRPHVKVTLYHVSRLEYALLKTYSGLVTIRTLNQTTAVYGIYNGSLKRIENHTDSKWTGPDGISGWGDVELYIYDLEFLS